MLLPSMFVVALCLVQSQRGSCQQDVSQHTPIIKNPPPVSRQFRSNAVFDDGGEMTYPDYNDTQRIDLQNKNSLRDASECKNYTIYENEIVTVISSMKPNSYVCLQNFHTENNETELKFSCNDVYLRFSCSYESLTIGTQNTTITICGEDSVPEVIGKTITLTYRRTLHGLHGGYGCFIQTIEVLNKQSNPLTDPQPISQISSNFTNCLGCGLTINRSRSLVSRKNVTSTDQAPVPRIVGGQSATRGDFPWMAYLKITQKTLYSTLIFSCGGSLITDKLVLTAAHCLEMKNIEKVEVTLGVNNFLESESGTVTITAQNFKMHPNYDEVDIVNDVAIIFLDDPVTFTDFIKPICLPTENIINLDDVTVQAAGWGRLAYEGGTTKVLQFVELKISVYEQCKAIWAYSGIYLNDSQICAFGWQKDTCAGDSGGPLFVKLQNNWVTVGIVSYGMKCADPTYPGVYTRVSSFIPWIKQFFPTGVCQ